MRSHTFLFDTESILQSEIWT